MIENTKCFECGSKNLVLQFCSCEDCDEKPDVYGECTDCGAYLGLINEVYYQ